MSRSPAVCVLIATLASRERGPYLHRALASVRAQAGVEARAIVVVNGAVADPALVAGLARTTGVTLLRRDEPSLPGALAAGRRLVDTPSFAQLDDDDELLPGALARRLERMAGPDRPDAVVTNGVIRNGARDSASMPDVAAVERAPLEALMARNWLLPGSALFRSATLDATLFDATPPYLEWTYVALRLVLRHRIAFLPDATVLHHEGLPFSVDQSRECALRRPLAFDAVLALELPAGIRSTLRRKRGAAWHAAAEAARLSGDLRAARAAHVKSLFAPGGWRYLAYTRRLAGRAAARPLADSAGVVP
jgi:hypothetical protein